MTLGNTHDIVDSHTGVLDDAQIADGTPTSGQAPLSNGDGTRTWGDVSGGSGPFVDAGSGTWKFDTSGIGADEIADEDVNAFLFMPGGGSGDFDLNATGEAKIEANNGSPGVHGVSPSRAKHNLLGGFGVVVPRLTADPNAGDSEEGQIYMNTSTHKFRGYANGSWVDLN